MWKKNKAFTLIEMLMVVTIIALLVSLILVSLSDPKIKSRDNKRIAEFDSIRKALELYYTDYGKYPSAENWDCLEFTRLFSNDEGMKKYLPVEPRDPICGQQWEDSEGPHFYCYSYITTNNGQEYKAHVRLENGSNYVIFSADGRDIAKFWE